MNDGAAFPFVMLGQGLLGLNDLGPHAWHWLVKDVLWATAGRLAIGGLLGARVSGDQRLLISWFGIRGIGSIYYLMCAINQGLARPLAEQIMALTLAVVAVSIVVHGVSVTPLMGFYARRKRRRMRH